MQLPAFLFSRSLRAGESRGRVPGFRPPFLAPQFPTPGSGGSGGGGGAGGPGTIAPSPDASIPTKIASAILTHFDERQEVLLKGIRRDSTDLIVRFRTARACSFVHVKITGPSGTLFDQLVDCQQGQIQEVSVTASTSGVYQVFLIPVQRTPLDGDILFDGGGAPPRPDFRTFGEYRVP